MKTTKHDVRMTATVTSLCVILQIAVLANDAIAQSRVRPRQSPMASRAQQALLHTTSARKAARRAQQIPSGYRIRHEQLASEVAPIESIPADTGEIIYEGGGESTDGIHLDHEPLGDWDSSWDGDVVYDDVGCNDGCNDGCGCLACSGYQSPWCYLASPVLTLQDASISAGVQAFTGPMNLESSGSFGFHEAFNVGVPLSLFPNSGMGFQIGNRWVQSNLSGSGFTNTQRNQTFTTIGAFRRASFGVEAGLAVDILRDRWYADVDLTQLRGQISWKFPAVHEWGYWFTAAGSEDTSASPLGTNEVFTWEPTSLHAFFYRRRMNLVPGGLLSLFAGFSAESDGLVGTKAFLPLTNAVAFQTDFLYLTPKEGTPSGGTLNESWNIGLSLVWRLGFDAQCTTPSYYQPMFDVADNGTMMVDRIGVATP